MVKRYVKLYRLGGVRAFFALPKRRGGHKLTAQVCQQAQMLLNEGPGGARGWPTSWDSGKHSAQCDPGRATVHNIKQKYF